MSDSIWDDSNFFFYRPCYTIHRRFKQKTPAAALAVSGIQALQELVHQQKMGAV